MKSLMTRSMTLLVAAGFSGLVAGSVVPAINQPMPTVGQPTVGMATPCGCAGPILTASAQPAHNTGSNGMSLQASYRPLPLPANG